MRENIRSESNACGTLHLASKTTTLSERSDEFAWEKMLLFIPKVLEALRTFGIYFHVYFTRNIQTNQYYR